MKDKVVDIAPYGPAVTDETKKLADAAKQNIIDGKLVVFAGPLYDQTGAAHGISMRRFVLCRL